MGAERKRLEEAAARRVHWRRWGPYLSERAWGTVREDYSADGNAWAYFPFAHAHLRAYRWNEDGLLGISDNHQRLCFAWSFWNGRDPILKERLFGLANPEGNHGEDVKEIYYYLDATPTHSYMRALYKYPQRAFPYEELRHENRRRGWDDPEFELADTGIFEDDRYFDLEVEYGKAGPDDLVIRLTATNRGPEAAPLHVLPTLWYRNTWSWTEGAETPRIAREGDQRFRLDHPTLGAFRLTALEEGFPLFTDNVTNITAAFGVPGGPAHAKDAFHRWLVRGDAEAVRQDRGTKLALHHAWTLGPGETRRLTLRLAPSEVPEPSGTEDQVLAVRRAEADEFHREVIGDAPPEAAAVARQALAGLLWSKQYYHYDVRHWMQGDPVSPPPPAARHHGRNAHWQHLHNSDVISMPDKWEYPWYAAWDLAFHCVPLALVDPSFSKDQLLLLLREWFMHPDGQIPAYEWNFGDANPPVHAWAARRVYSLEAKSTGRRDVAFLERVFHKLLINFTWWVNKKDQEGNNVFEGGFLGLDNIGVFDRNRPLPPGASLEQSDGTSWMGMYCLHMMGIAEEIARHDPAYEDVASKFLEHFFWIAAAIEGRDVEDPGLWHEEDGFYYDRIQLAGGRQLPIRLRSMVGLVPLLAVEIIESDTLEKLGGFSRRMQWFIENRPWFRQHVEEGVDADGKARRLLAFLKGDKLRRVLAYVLDEDEFLGPYGIRSMSRHHLDHPYVLRFAGEEYRVGYEPAESRSGMFGGNSNWRGPVWFPLNYLLIESLEKYHQFYGHAFQVRYPSRTGELMDLGRVARSLAFRLIRHFLPSGGSRPIHGKRAKFQQDPHFRDHLLFPEYFDGDTGEGLGAMHQTGWTALVANLVDRYGAPP